MNENIVKLICIIIGIVLGFYIVPFLIGAFEIILKIVVGLSLAVLFYNLWLKYSGKKRGRKVYFD